MGGSSWSTDAYTEAARLRKKAGMSDFAYNDAMRASHKWEIHPTLDPKGVKFRESRDSDYVELEAVRAEIAATRQLFENQDWPMIDVSRRSIEETAAAVMNLLADRKEVIG